MTISLLALLLSITVSQPQNASPAAKQPATPTPAAANAASPTLATLWQPSSGLLRLHAPRADLVRAELARFALESALLDLLPPPATTSATSGADLSAAVDPLAQLMARFPGAALVGQLNFAVLRAALWNEPGSASKRHARLSDRLGLPALGRGSMQLWLSGPAPAVSTAATSPAATRRALTQLQVVLNKDESSTSGLFGALAPALPLIWPRDVPLDAPALTTLQVLPERWWIVTESLRLLSLVFEVDVLTCPRCQSSMQKIAFITQPAVIPKFLDSIGLSTEASSVSAAA